MPRYAMRLASPASAIRRTPSLVAVSKAYPLSAPPLSSLQRRDKFANAVAEFPLSQPKRIARRRTTPRDAVLHAVRPRRRDAWSSTEPEGGARSMGHWLRGDRGAARGST